MRRLSMIKGNSLFFLLVATTILSIVSCGRSSDKSRVIAKVGREKITENYLFAALRAKKQINRLSKIFQRKKY